MRQRAEWGEERTTTRAVQIDQLCHEMRKIYEHDNVDAAVDSEPASTAHAAVAEDVVPQVTAQLAIDGDVAHLTMTVQAAR